MLNHFTLTAKKRHRALLAASVTAGLSFFAPPAQLRAGAMYIRVRPCIKTSLFGTFLAFCKSDAEC
jgi:hypothetical protein